MNFLTKLKIMIPTGLALFAMFFGAGNMIFPLKIGSVAGQYAWIGLLGFIISGVGVPFLGLFAGALYEGDYWQFFERLGKTFAFVVVAFLVLIIGPLFAAPRTETVAYSTLVNLLPEFFRNKYLFDFIYFSLVYLVISKQSRVVDIIGLVLSPVKITTFTLLIILGLHFSHGTIMVQSTAEDVFKAAFIEGYNTMDLLASLFFCSVAYKNIQNKCNLAGVTEHSAIMKMTLFSCIIGATLISLVYAGFMFVAATHASELQNIPTAELLGKTAYTILGQYGAVFVGVCVTVACLTTASALAEVTTEFFHEIVFKEKVSRGFMVFCTLASMYIMAILGFDGIMAIAGPVLNILYPALILLCIVNIVLKFREMMVAQRV